MSGFDTMSHIKDKLLKARPCWFLCLTKHQIFSIIFTMELYTASKFSFEKKIEIVETYLNRKGSLREIAHLHGISYMTLWRWVKRYKKGGKGNLRKGISYKRSSRRVPDKIEERIMLLKEHMPGLTTKKAEQILKHQGLHISYKTIWTVWKRYGLVNRPKHDPLNLICSGSPEIEDGMQQARQFIKKGEIKRAAKTLNNLPALIDDTILKEIPEEFLSSRRRLEQLNLLFSAIPPQELFEKARKIRIDMERNGYLFSSIFAGLLEVLALQWMRDPEKQLEILSSISKRILQIRNTGLRYTFHLLKAFSYSELLQADKALLDLNVCRRLLISLCYPYYWITFGDLLTFVSRYRKSISCYKKVIDEMEVEQPLKQLLYVKTVAAYEMIGQYQQTMRFLKRIKTMKIKETLMSRVYQIEASVCFVNGQFEKASHLYQKAFEKARRANFRNIVYVASLGLAQIARALGKKTEAQATLRRYLPLMKRYRMKKETLNIQFLLRQISIPGDLWKFPVHRLQLLLNRARETLRFRDYYEALYFAKRKGLLGIFHRYIVFFPEPVLHLLEKGKPTGLPKRILKFPVFNQKTLVYHTKLLGNFIVHKNQEYVRTKLAPKEKAFLIHLTLKADEPRKFILVSDLYQNFWSDSKNPSSLLAHLLVRLKKKLRLPGHLLMISSRYEEPRLVNRGVYLTTDYNDFKVALTHAKALEHAGEWGFAKREYLRAFKLFRGEPFKKMYDPWSEHMRRVILNRLETEALHFAKSCLGHNNEIRQKKRRTPSAKCRGGNMVDAKKVLEKVAKIIPQSEEIKEMVNGFA
jgi:transposase/tetratricopeptide (TPR) repeat protein